MEFETWINTIGALMQLHGLISNQGKLDNKSWEEYYNEGLNPEQTLDEEFGILWRFNTPTKLNQHGKD